MKAFLASAICVGGLVFPAGATAIVCAPPGNSGVSQYLETVPGDSCNAPPSGSRGKAGGSLPPATLHKLAAQGAAGQAVERLVSSAQGTPSAGSPGAAGTHGAGANGVGGMRAARLAAEPGRGLIGGLLHPILTGSSSGGLGYALPLLLAAALGAVVATMVARRRAKHS